MRHFTCCLWLTISLAAALFSAPVPASAGEYFKIKIVDEQTGRGVPLVELKTVNGIRLWTDSAGVVAFNEPGLLDRQVFFHVRSHGYEFPKDGFGFRGRRVKTTPGEEVVWKIRRTNIAERLYRVTGQGIYRDSVLLGERPPLDKPLLDGGVLGSDSVENAVYRGRVYWFWGDTNRASYPLGNFHVPGATSRLPESGGLDIERGVNLEYFTAPAARKPDAGAGKAEVFAKETARMPGEGPTWIGGLCTLRGRDGRERMFALYVKVRGFLDVYQRGLVEFDDEKQAFEKVTEFDMDAPLYPGGHPFTRREGDTDYLYFATPFPLIRVPATPEALADTARYEAYTCLAEGSRGEEMRLDRDDAGKLRYAWRKNTPVVGQQLQAKLIAAGKARPEELLLHLQDAATGKRVLAHGGSVYWNEYRKRWVMIAVESGGDTSFLGEVWFAEADTPLGPWVYARKIVTHEKYSFYNPKQHPMFDKQDGRLIFFEGTYSHTFSGNDDPTPRYDYNQVLYKLDLADARLALPVAMYDLSPRQDGRRFADVRAARKQAEKNKAAALPPVAFFALDRPSEGAVAVYAEENNGTTRLLVKTAKAKDSASPKPLFFALPGDAEAPPPTSVALYEYVASDGAAAYSTDPSWNSPGLKRRAGPLCRVWRSPVVHTFPRN